MYRVEPSCFRPLAGISGLGTGSDTVILEMARRCFRPLAGISGLGTSSTGIGPPSTREVSVPLRGLVVLGPCVDFLARNIAQLFPSPCGD